MTAAQRSALTGVLLLLLRGLHVHAGIFSSGSRRVLDTQSPSSECIGTDPHIQRYLTSASTTSVDEKFFVQGWRWHTMSLIREARRLHQHAERLENENNCSSNEGMTALHTVADYCVNFNMRGLHKIEKDLFFPWVRVKTKAIDNAEISQAFDSVLDKLEQDRRSVESLGKSLVCSNMACCGVTWFESSSTFF